MRRVKIIGCVSDNTGLIIAETEDNDRWPQTQQKITRKTGSMW